MSTKDGRDAPSPDLRSTRPSRESRHACSSDRQARRSALNADAHRRAARRALGGAAARWRGGGRSDGNQKQPQCQASPAVPDQGLDCSAAAAAGAVAVCRSGITGSIRVMPPRGWGTACCGGGWADGWPGAGDGPGGSLHLGTELGFPRHRVRKCHGFRDDEDALPDLQRTAMRGNGTANADCRRVQGHCASEEKTRASNRMMPKLKTSQLVSYFSLRNTSGAFPRISWRGFLGEGLKATPSR